MIATLNKTICNVCGNSDFNDYINCSSFSYVKCSNCGLAFQDPQPTQNEINKMYEDDYYKYILENHNAFFNLTKLGLDDVNIDKLYNKFPNEKRFLDIGCATGLLLNYVREKGWDTHGVEICKQSVHYARSNFNLNILDKPLEECKFRDNYFQVIHFAHLIEHVPNPNRLLNEVYRILQPGGYVIVTTPNTDGLFAKIYKDKWRLAIQDHLFLFSKKNLKLLLEKVGFSLLDQLSWGGIPINISKGMFKKLTDKWIKQLNLGDVMLFLAVK
ncbi:MAG: class I SAM-dependent methyltransferase [Spirochaetota bacterium]|nr:class I SAM-dependent methyltransferase [Spirochaetota bacterium]